MSRFWESRNLTVMKLTDVLEATEHASQNFCLKAIFEALDGVKAPLSEKCSALWRAKDIVDGLWLSKL